MNAESSRHICVMGDVHARIDLAVAGLRAMEDELGCKIDQVFSVGDLGLFLQEEDWNFLTGPKHHRKPERSGEIRAAWEAWSWPLSVIGGNHEPYHHYRGATWHGLRAEFFYQDAGWLGHGISGLRVAGLSGIHHPEHLQWLTSEERARSKRPRVAGWPDMVEQVRAGRFKPQRLTYYKQAEIDLLKNLSPKPHLLLLHDWPEEGPMLKHIVQGRSRPESEIVKTLRPDWVCCGHHHQSASFALGSTRVRALNLITDELHQRENRLRAGWAWLARWDPQGQGLHEIGLWPGGG